MRDGGGGDEQGDAFCSSSETLRLDEVLYGKGFGSLVIQKVWFKRIYALFRLAEGKVLAERL